ncbi:head-tail connector protein [Duganella sp.]|uniref:head-tail connector protein n=1 Tax=Duganella sp. TaxID=1904440 RepID=UPI0031D59E4D
MPILTLEEAKADLRVDSDDADETIQALLDAAIQSASDRINRPIPWQDEDGADVEVPASVNAAIRLELRALYDNPDSVHGRAFESLLAPYIVDRGI